MGTKRISIPLSKLAMDLENPRHPEAESQKAIIDWMTEGPSKSGDKLIALAKDIADNGVNPADQINVVAAGNGNYTVLEGNRRVTALKLLTNPDTAPNRWQDRFRRVANTAKKIIPSELEAIVWDNAEEAYHFIELKHMGESDGAGTVRWSTQQKARHDARANRTNRDWRAIQLIDYIKDSNHFDKDTKAHAASPSFPITTLTRILSDKQMRDFLGIEDLGRQLHFTLDEKEAAKAISKVINDLGSRQVNVSDVKNSGERERYRDDFPKKARPDSTKAIAPTPVLPQPSTPPSATPASAKPGKTPVRTPANRTTLVPAGANIPIPNSQYAKIRSVYGELRNLKIENGSTYKGFPIAATALLRAFLEMSVNAYIDVKQIRCPSPKGYTPDFGLAERIKLVKEVVDPTVGSSKGYKRWLNQITANPSKDGSPNMLNDVVHSDTTIVSANDLKTIWDNYQPFLEAMWLEIKDSLAV